MHLRCASVVLLMLVTTVAYSEPYYEDGYDYSSQTADNRDYSYHEYSSDPRKDQELNKEFKHYAYYDNSGYYYDQNYYYGNPNYEQSYSYPRRAYRKTRHYRYSNYTPSMPSQIASTEKTIIVDPNLHGWGAYLDGKLVRSGLATAGAKWCPDIGRPCRTRAGVFHIASLGSSGCKSTRYPVGEGGAPMPFCMYFNGNQALHGSYEVVAGNISHGCVRLHVDDARWIRFNFANVGTKVIVRPY